MTFDNIKEMQIGSKKVKEAWLNGRQVYPSKKRIMDSLVCWYDPGKQQCTNESMAANPVLADLSGNGHDIECFNFAWSGMSGIGGYVFSKPLANWYKPSNNNDSYTTEGNVLHITKLNTNKNVYYVTNNGNKTNTIVEITGNNYTTKPFKIKISGLPEGKLVSLTGLVGNDTVSPNISVIYETKYFGNGEHIVESSSIVWDNEELEPTVVNYPSIYINSDTADDVDITIEILPEYPNALVSDGVDDYCYTDGLPILTDYTVIAKRKILADTVSALASKASNNDSTDGAFIFDAKNVAGYIACNFGANNALVELYPEDVSYQTKESYNGNSIIKLNHVDTDKLSLFTFSAQKNFVNQYALYSFLLFDRTLTTAEIEWVKKNMIEYGGVLKTDWMQEPWRRLNRNRITGTESSNVLKITSCTETQNFKETGVNAYIPSFKIKVTGLKNGIRLIYMNTSIVNFRIEEDGIYTLEEQEGDWIGLRFEKKFENENIVIQQLLS